MSCSQTRRLVNVVRSFATLWPTVSAESKATQRLFEAVLQRMEHTIQMDVFIPLYSKRYVCLHLIDLLADHTARIDSTIEHLRRN